MPYIKGMDRVKLNNVLMELCPLVTDVGELNYCITKLLLGTHTRSYQDYNELIGVLECCKLEFYRRAVSKYEDTKIEQNGDVY